MNRVQRQRRRLAKLIDEAGSQASLAKILGTADSYISQLLTARNGIARKFCERLEKGMRKPDGWMDQWLPEEVKPDVLRSMFEEVIATSFDKPEDTNNTLHDDVESYLPQDDRDNRTC